MKKFVVAIALVALCAVTSFAEDNDKGFACGIWFGLPKGTATANVDGVALGIPVLQCKDLTGLCLSLIGSSSAKTTGFDFTLFGFNNAESLEGVQVSFVNLLKKQHGDYAIQVGWYNQSGENGLQFGFINNARNNASFQLGLININKNGWLPVMIFFNLSK